MQPIIEVQHAPFRWASSSAGRTFRVSLQASARLSDRPDARHRRTSISPPARSGDCIDSNRDANNMNRLSPLALAASIAGTALLAAAPAAQALTNGQAIAVQQRTLPDLTGQLRIGKASYYHRMFEGRTMADGKRFDPNAANAASRTLPLGTLAKVTNRENGRSAIVVIQDRGPYVDDRIIDLSPKTADVLGMRNQGVARVEVAPIRVPLPDGRAIAGAGAPDGGAVANAQ
jgi:rare lipoprotein A